MSISELATGDLVRIVTISSGSFGAAPTITTSSTDLSCRIDSYGGGEDRRAGRADKRRRMTAYFLTEPAIQVGKFLKWTATGSPNNLTTFSNAIYMRVLSAYPEGRPGEAPAYWVVECEECSIRDMGGQV